MLGELVGPGDIIVDLSWNVETLDLLAWCGEHDVRYLNTSLEEWDPYGDIENKSPYERSLYSRQMRIRLLKRPAQFAKQPESDRHHRSRREPGPRQPLHEASAARDRHDDARGRAADGRRRRQRGVREAHRRRRGSRRGIVCPAQPGHRHQGDPHLGTRHAGVLAAEGDQRVRQHVVDRGLLTRKARRRPSSDGERTSAASRRTHTCRSAVLAIRSFSRSRAFGRSCTPGSPPADRLSGWWSAMPSPSPSATTSRSGTTRSKGGWRSIGPRCTMPTCRATTRF